MTTVRDFDYPAGGRVRTGTLYRRSSAPDEASRPCVVVVHGLTANRRLPEIEQLCGILAADFDVLAIDLRGHGASDDRFTWGREEWRDLADLVTFLRPLHPAVGVLGFSIGGFIAIASAALAEAGNGMGRPDAICTVGAPAHLRIWRYRFGLRGLSGHVGMFFRRRQRGMRIAWPDPGWARADHLIARVAPVPLLLLHGDLDWLVDPGHCRSLYDAARDPREMTLIAGGLHAEYVVAQDPDLIARPAIDFFARTLQTAGLSPLAGEVSLTRDRS